MSMADMLVDGTAHNQMLSFMDGNAAYNQIMVAEEDIHKTAFMCLGHIGKIQPFSSLLRLKQEQTFEWKEKHQQAFEEIKLYLSNPPVLSPPKRGEPLKLYVSASEVSMGSILVQDNKEGKEHEVYYLSKSLTEVERKCVPQKAIKGQAVADFLADHPREEIENMDSLDIANANLLTRAHTCLNNPIYSVYLTPWKLYFDGSKIDVASGAGTILEEPLGIRHCYSFQLDFQCTNNRAEYKALIIGLEMLVELGIQLLKFWEILCLEATWEHIPREENFVANELAQIATGIQMPEDYVQRIIKVGKKSPPSVLTRGMEIDVNSAIITEDDWRHPIINYLQYTTLISEKRVRIMALNYLMWNEDLV
ncbi:hypothetical protein L3X38_023703 [Prunus dulcis]|uniref:Reverse transcriptase/retrotransposon-derived protein RNase H-like domain-containing protein n=1 Tax=Prunus dulcis TaxID=3755 RepID=A0AAD4W0Y4_PRUDU|nr:hypothetical protein L3X38_023703 [Prunus dulcis]